MNCCDRQCGWRLLFLLLLLGHGIGIGVGGCRGRVGVRFLLVHLEAQRAHRGVKDGLGQLFLAFAGEQFCGGLVRQHHQDVVADRRHVDLQLVGGLGVVDLQGHGDLRVALAVLVGQVDGERVQRHEGGWAFGVVLGLGLGGGLAGLGLGMAIGAFFVALDGFFLHQEEGGTAAGQHHQQRGGNDDDQLLLAAFGGRGGIGGGGGGGCG